MNEIFYVWENMLTHDFQGMLKSEYERAVWNAHKLITFYRSNGFDTIDSVIEYIKKYSPDVNPVILKR